ncbi:hypothetical protein MRX96_035643 [Rhipicephalus microplus]
MRVRVCAADTCVASVYVSSPRTCGSGDVRIKFITPQEMTTSLLPLAPAPIKPAFTCGDKEFLCTGIKECILLSKVCDFKDDCSNGADESRCGSCDFTRDLCGLENEDPSARFGWNWTSVENGRKINDFPSTDSLSDIKGAYAAFSLRNPEAPVNKMMKGLTTPPLGQIAHSCVVKFYVYVPNDPTAMLMFGVRPRQVFDFKQSTLQFLGTVSGRKLKGQWTKMFGRVGDWDAGARFVYLTNTLGVSIDRIEYNMCHPDSQSEGVEAAETVTCRFSDPSNCGWFPRAKRCLIPCGLSTLRVGISGYSIGGPPTVILTKSSGVTVAVGVALERAVAVHGEESACRVGVGGHIVGRV